MKKYNINGMPFYLPENLDEFKKNSNKIAKIYYKKGRYKAYKKLLDDDELIETLKNNDCLFVNAPFIHLCREKPQVIESIFGIKLECLKDGNSFIMKNDIKTIRSTLHKDFYEELLNYYKDDKGILYSYHHFVILEEICRLKQEGKIEEEIKKIMFDTETLYKKEKEYLNTGIEKYNKKEFDSALEYLNKCIILNKENIKAYEYIAKSYYELKKYDAALEKFNEYIKLNPNNDNYEIYNLMGICFYYKKDYKSSVEYFSKCIELKDDDPLYYSNRAIAKFENNEFESSIDDCYKCLKLNIKDPQRIYFYIAKSNYELYKYEEFAENFNKAIELNFNSNELNFYKGFLNYREGKYKKAKEAFNESIKLKYKIEDSYMYIGIINYKEKNFKEAKECLTQCISLNIDNYESYFYRLKTNYMLDNYEEFRDDFYKVKKICDIPLYADDPSDFLKLQNIKFNISELNFYEGFLNYREGKYKKAKEAFNESIKSEYKIEDSYMYIGIINYEEENFEEAVNSFSEVVKNNNCKAYYFRACSLYRLEKYILALYDLDNAVKLNNAYGSAYDKRAEIKLYMSIKNNDEKMKNEAKEDIQSALKYKTYDSSIIKFLIILDCKADINYFDNIKINDDDIYYMAVYYFINDRSNEAKEYFIKYLEIKGEDYKEKDKIYYNISVCLYKLMKYAEALEYLEKAIEYDRDNYKYLNTMALMCYRISKCDDKVMYKDFNLTRNMIFEKSDKYCNFDFDDYRYYAASFFKFAMNKNIYDEKTKNKIFNNYIKKIKKLPNENYYETYILQGYNDYYSANIIYDDFIYKNSSITNSSIINDGSYSDKLFYYDKAIESKTNNMEIYLEKAKLLFDIREHDEAIKYFNMLLEKGKYKYYCLYYLGLYNYINENYEEAIKNFQLMSNRYTDVYLYLSNYELGNYELSDIHYFNTFDNSINNLFKVKKGEDIEYDNNIKKLLESAPKEISSNKKYADTIAVICYLLEISRSCFYKLGIIKYSNEAIDYCDMLIEESNNNYFYYIKGSVQYIIFSYDINNTEMEKEAFKNMRKYFEYNIFNIFESNKILRIWHKYGSYNYKFYMEKGENFIKENDYQNALECFYSSLYILDSDNVKYDIYYNLAVCFCEIGNYKNGINIFEYILNFYKNNIGDYYLIENTDLVYNIIKYKFKEYNENVCSKEDILKYFNDFESKIPNFKFIIDYYTAKIEYDENKIIDCIENIIGYDNDDIRRFMYSANIDIIISLYNDFIDTLSNMSDNIQIKKYSYISLVYYLLSNKTEDVSYKNKGLEYYEKLFNKTNGEILHRYYRDDLNIIGEVTIIMDSMECDYFKMMLDKKFKEKLYNEIISIYNNRRIHNDIINIYAFKSYYELGEYAKSISVINEIRDTFLNYNNGKIKNAYSYLSYIKLENFAEAYKISRDIDKKAFNDEYFIEKLNDIIKNGTDEQKTISEQFYCIIFNNN